MHVHGAKVALSHALTFSVSCQSHAAARENLFVEVVTSQFLVKTNSKLSVSCFQALGNLGHCETKKELPFIVIAPSITGIALLVESLTVHSVGIFSSYYQLAAIS